VLFADVVHSMDISAAVGAERWREIVSELVNRSATVVRHYEGTVGSFTGDGIMAVFGAPTALEDHAVRACRAALEVQQEAARLAAEVQRRDGIDLQLRVGLNSGRVITGETDSGPMGYTAIGEQVGMAQRMESVAPPGGVMLSESTARLVERTAVLADAELVHIKGADAPVRARRLLGMAEDHWAARQESSLVGRRWEMAAVDGLLERAIDGRGGVVGVVGPAGIGKSRLAREVATLAADRGADVFTAYCESHTREISFHVVAQLLRSGTHIADLDRDAGRAQLRAQVPEANPEDLLLLDDLLGIADPDAQLPNIDRDARRRRLTALVNAASLARTTPAVFLIEDAHWIDEASESMLAEFLAVTAKTPALVVITYRPEYQGALARLAGAQAIALAPLSDSETATLTDELLGSDASVRDLAATIAARASGNPFFAEEMVRELVQRGVLEGERGAHICDTAIADVTVPATLQATIAARIDRLDADAKRTLSAAAVIGSRFGAELLTALSVDQVFDELVSAELIDQVRFTQNAEYAFRHPLIRTVAYESQLKSDRSELHRRLAAAIEAGVPELADENAALIAEHLEAAGDVRDAYDWHMRAGAWSTHRDAAAAWLSWERARQIADGLPADDEDRAAMRLAARLQMCGASTRVGPANRVDLLFEELRELCIAVGDNVSLALGMSGLVYEHMIHARVSEARQVVSEQLALAESVGNPAFAAGLSLVAIAVEYESGNVDVQLRWSQRVIELANDDPGKANQIFQSPQPTALAARGSARWRLGRPGWRDDFSQAMAMARGADPLSHAIVITYKYLPAIPCGALIADDTALREIDEALHIAEESVNDIALGVLRMTMGVALLHRDSVADQEIGLEQLGQVRELCLQERFYSVHLPVVEMYFARDTARRGHRDIAIPLMRDALDALFANDQLSWAISATNTLVEVLLARHADRDVAEASVAIDRLAAAQADDGLVVRDIMLLRLRALVAHARGDQGAYRELLDRYRAMATSLGFEGHMAWAKVMSADLH
jgi:class 3 adenylate cyclase